MVAVVISQPMFFPWLGIFEQIRLADTFVHYDDVQLPQGRSFITRVQIKTSQGVRWLTVPVRRTGRNINEVIIDESQDWRKIHLGTLRHAYGRAPFKDEMLELVCEVYEARVGSLADFNCLGIECLARYLGLQKPFLRSSSLDIGSSSSERLLNIVKALAGDVYVTGHGARNYLNHELFERSAVRVEYMQYRLAIYPQQHGDFTPYVSVLDAIANLGPRTTDLITSQAVYWRTFLDG